MAESPERLERSLDELATPVALLEPSWSDVVERVARAKRRTGLLGGWCQGLQRPRTGFERGTVTCAWWKRENGPFGLGFVGPELFVGRAAIMPGRRLRLLFADGRSLGIPARDGSYLYRVAEQELIRAAPQALVIRQRGREVARLAVGPLYESARLRSGPGTDPAGPTARTHGACSWHEPPSARLRS